MNTNVMNKAFALAGKKKEEGENNAYKGYNNDISQQRLPENKGL